MPSRRRLRHSGRLTDAGGSAISVLGKFRGRTEVKGQTSTEGTPIAFDAERTRSFFSSFRPNTATAAPASANPSAIPRPIPPLITTRHNSHAAGQIKRIVRPHDALLSMGEAKPLFLFWSVRGLPLHSPSVRNVKKIDGTPLNRKIRLAVTTEYREVSSDPSACGNSSRIPSYFETARAALSIRSETSFGCET